MEDNSFPKSARLSGRRAIDGLFEMGDSGFVYPVRYVLAVEKSDCSGVAVLVSVPKKFHKRAVGRNRLKRRMREAFRTQSGALKAIAGQKGVKINIALLYGCRDVLEFEKIRDVVGKIIGQVYKMV